MDNPQATEDEPNEFSALTSLDLLAAFLHAKYGEEALREAFSLVELHREQLVKAADILDSKGLAHVADILADIAASRPSEIESNPYPPDSLNGRCWAWSWSQRHRETPDQRLERMRREAAGKRRQMH